jgi:MFS family permease
LGGVLRVVYLIFNEGYSASEGDRLAVLGCLMNLFAQVLWLTEIQAHPAYLTHFLPAQLIGGIGVGLTIPSLLAAGSASLPPARFGTGSGALNMARQIGTVLGVAGLIAILGHVDPTDPVASFRDGVYLVAAFGITAGLTAAAFLIRRAGSAPVPVVAAAESG